MSKPLIRLKKKLTIENLWIYVIASLMIKPTYAYHVRKLINEFFGFSPTTITLYSVIYRLKKSGLIKEDLVAGEKVYKPTDEGVKELEEAISYMEQMIKRLKEITYSTQKP
ncbi:MAG: helix-turn-helix transcriptional regulator [Desulfurococcaceae archaeon TW002]